MKKQQIPLLVTITLIFVAFTIGFFIGRNYNSSDIIITVPVSTSPPEAPAPLPTNDKNDSPYPVNINIATKDQLMTLPGIGAVYAQRILDYRRVNGKFDKPEDLLNVEGIGTSRLVEILDLITTGGK